MRTARAVPTPWLCRKTMISRTAFCSAQAAVMRPARTGPMPSMQAIRLRLDDVEDLLAEGPQQLLGPVYAKKLLRAFGEKVFDVIEAEPDRLHGRHRSGASRPHHGRLGRAEGGPRDHGLPAQPWRRHGTGGSHLQDPRR